MTETNLDLEEQREKAAIIPGARREQEDPSPGARRKEAEVVQGAVREDAPLNLTNILGTNTNPNTSISQLLPTNTHMVRLIVHVPSLSYT